MEYEEVNMYNFRTRVPKRVEYPPLTMSFYDDNKNAAHSFYTAYMRAMSPIANIKQNMPQTDDYKLSGMDFTRAPSAATFSPTSVNTSGHSASLGHLAGNHNSIIQEMKLWHIFDYGNSANVYHFYNPRILSFTPSDLSQMETGEGADFEFEFAYDGLFIDNGYNLIDDQGRLSELTGREGSRPIDPTYGSDAQSSDAASQYSTPSAQSQEENAPSASLYQDDNRVVSNAFTTDFNQSTFTPSSPTISPISVGQSIGLA